MELYFPAQKESGKVKQQYLKLKQRALLMLEQITGKEVEQSKINALDGQLLSSTAPQQFWGPNGVEAKTVVSFEDVCIAMQQHVTKDPKSMTVLEFFRTLEAVKKKAKAQERKK